MKKNALDDGVIAREVPSQVAPDAGPVETPQPSASRVRIVARFQSALNAALWQNHVPMLSELSIANLGDEPLGDVEGSVKNLGRYAASWIA